MSLRDHPDVHHREDAARERAHEALEHHFATACTCDQCGEPRELGTFDDGEFALCSGCARRLAAAFMPEILAASQSAIDAYTGVIAEPKSRGVWA